MPKSSGFSAYVQVEGCGSPKSMGTYSSEISHAKPPECSHFWAQWWEVEDLGEESGGALMGLPWGEPWNLQRIKDHPESAQSRIVQIASTVSWLPGHCASSSSVAWLATPSSYSGLNEKEVQPNGLHLDINADQLSD